MNMALAIDMPDAPMTEDTITAGSDGDDNDQGDNDQEDAPVTQDAITAGGGSEDNDDEDNSGQKGDNNDNSDNNNEPTNTGTGVTNKPNCPIGQERALFEDVCKPNQCRNDLDVGCPNNVQSSECRNDLDVGCQNLASQIQGDGISAALPSEGATSQATSQVNDCGNGDDPLPTWCQNLASQIQGDENAAALASEQD
jgi:hypothetical protein